MNAETQTHAADILIQPEAVPICGICGMPLTAPQIESGDVLPDCDVHYACWADEDEYAEYTGNLS